MTLDAQLRMYKSMLKKAITHQDELPLSGSAARDVKVLQLSIKYLERKIIEVQVRNP